MAPNVSRSTYDKLRAAILDFVTEHPHEAIDRFKPNLISFDTNWKDVEQFPLPAADFIAAARSTTTPQTLGLVELFNEHRDELKWEQSYTAADDFVGNDMLNGYGFVEVIGKNGPFVSTKVRTGIGVWGPNIDYPVHNHMAEEIYAPLAGSAEFTINDSAYQSRHADDIIYVPSNQRHGFRTTSEPFVVFYAWQNGDLRQKSTFG